MLYSLLDYTEGYKDEKQRGIVGKRTQLRKKKGIKKKRLPQIPRNKARVNVENQPRLKSHGLKGRAD